MWNPVDLLLATREPWLLRKIARRVLNKWQGEQYLSRALQGLPSSETLLRNELAEILRNPSKLATEDWD
jgi:hypothetical protein